MILESLDGDDPIPQREVIPMLYRVLLTDGGPLEIQAEAAHYISGRGVEFLAGGHVVGFVPSHRLVGFTSRERAVPFGKAGQ